ncbi:MAG: NAD(P)-binding domain-containing protein [Eubacteriales bacterium]|nr:NAD(P)-binding domain-containing protein [Eubacteriales bacterium]
MKRSITVPMKAEGLTTLKIRYDYKTDHFAMEAMKQWEPDLDFSKYNKEFYAESILTDDVVYYNTKQVRELFEKYELGDYLDEIQTLLRKGKHFGIEAYYHEGYDILYMSNQHSRKLGINNKLHATLAGGIRRHNKDEEEIEVIIDGLNLGRGMSFKNVAGHINMGGCKQTVTMDPIDLTNLQHVGFLGYCIDKCRTMTGPDMNFPTELADVENEYFSMQFTNGPKTSVLGETGKPTAYGVYKTLKQAVKFKEGTESIDGKSVTLIGLGAVGWYMGEYLLQENIKLYVTDLDPARAQQFIDEHEGDITAIPLENAYFNECDILCPCAIGGQLSDETIPKLNCKYVWGSANNGLKASSTEEEIRLAEKLKERDIVFQVEWWHNTAGVICGYQEYVDGKNATEEKLYKAIDDIMPPSTYMNLKMAEEKGITAVENAYDLADQVIYGDMTLEDINW